MLVAGADEGPDLAEEAAGALEHVLAEDGVRVHQGPLRGVERARLVDDLARDPQLPDVVEKRGEFRHSLRVGVEPEPLADGEDELDHVAAVLAGVGVVRLDHVAEQVRGPLIRVLQLEHLVVLLLPLPADPGDDQHHGQEQQQCLRMARRRERRQQAERRKDRVEAVGGEHAPNVVSQRESYDGARSDVGRGGIEHELCPEGGGVEGDVLPTWPVRAREVKDDRRTE